MSFYANTHNLETKGVRRETTTGKPSNQPFWRRSAGMEDLKGLGLSRSVRFSGKCEMMIFTLATIDFILREITVFLVFVVKIGKK